MFALNSDPGAMSVVTEHTQEQIPFRLINKCEQHKPRLPFFKRLPANIVNLTERLNGTRLFSEIMLLCYYDSLIHN
jgi:hypothetical protein